VSGSVQLASESKLVLVSGTGKYSQFEVQSPIKESLLSLVARHKGRDEEKVGIIDSGCGLSVCGK